ncbi:hypothetical protein NW759_001874 [Fusarium solani]|nr:hypothetical protein NW759_001874 [Fusarium solani]
MIPTAEVEAVVEDGDEGVGEDVEVDMVRDGREAEVASQLLGRGRIMAKAMARRITRMATEEIRALWPDLRCRIYNEAIQSKVEELESVKRELESTIQAKLDLRSQACESVSRLRSKLTVAEEAERELRAELLAVKEAASEKGVRIEALLKVLKELGD